MPSLAGDVHSHQVATRDVVVCLGLTHVEYVVVALGRDSVVCVQHGGCRQQAGVRPKVFPCRAGSIGVPSRLKVGVVWQQGHHVRSRLRHLEAVDGHLLPRLVGKPHVHLGKHTHHLYGEHLVGATRHRHLLLARHGQVLVWCPGHGTRISYSLYG